MAERYLGAVAAGVYLIRPDQHVTARWSEFDQAAVVAAVKTALGAAV
jgi:3-(3-hydroxy-phenyl)propionate hydroxylase